MPHSTSSPITTTSSVNIMPPLSIYPTTRMDKISSSHWKPFQPTKPPHKPQPTSDFLQHINFDFAPTTTTSPKPKLSTGSSTGTMQPGSLLLLQSPVGSYLIQISTTSPLTGRLLRPYDWESLVEFGSYLDDAWDREYLSESTLDALITEDTDATVEPSQSHLASISLSQRRFYLNHPKASPAAKLRYGLYKKLQRLDLQETCAICRLSYQDTDMLKGLNCGHVFHESCLDEVMKVRKGACPYCGYT